MAEEKKDKAALVQNPYSNKPAVAQNIQEQNVSLKDSVLDSILDFMGTSKFTVFFLLLFAFIIVGFVFFTRYFLFALVKFGPFLIPLIISFIWVLLRRGLKTGKMKPTRGRRFMF